MIALTRDDLYSLEDYSKIRADFRRKVIEHKRDRQLALAPNATLYFEDRMTMHYQIQEMLRVERIFESEGIEDELQAYNPLIPDGDNWKATFMLEYPDVEERREALGRLLGVENRVWVEVEGHDRVYAIADEDLDRSTEDKTSSVHFLRFQLDPAMIQSLRGGASLAAGIDHEALSVEIDPVAANIRDSLLGDLN